MRDPRLVSAVLYPHGSVVTRVSWQDEACAHMLINHQQQVGLALSEPFEEGGPHLGTLIIVADCEPSPMVVDPAAGGGQATEGSSTTAH
jgi:hypothetical protein